MRLSPPLAETTARAKRLGGLNDPASSRARRPGGRSGRRRSGSARECRCGGRRLGGDDRPDARAADVVGRARAVAARCRRRRNRAHRDGIGARDRRVPGRCGCRGHARRRKRARGVRGRACATRADEAARARAAGRAPPPRGRGRGGARRHASPGRRGGRPSRRGDSGRRRRGRRGACRRGCADGRAAAGLVPAWGRAAKRIGERRRGVRPTRDATRRGEHLRGDRAPRPRGRDATGAVRPPGRPLRRPLPPARARDRRARLGGVRGSGSLRGRDGRRHAVSADPGGPDCAHRRGLPCRAPRSDRQGQRRDRAARQGAHGAVRQDRHADARAARARAGRRLRRHRPRRAAASRRLRRPAVRARARGGARARGAGARLRAHFAGAGRGGTRAGDRGACRWPERCRWQLGVVARAWLLRRRGGGARARREQ